MKLSYSPMHLAGLGKIPAWVRGVALASVLLGLAAEAGAGAIFYDTTASQATNNHFRIWDGVEIGDEVFLPAPLKLTSFAFEYYGTNFSGNEQLRLRFYRQDPVTFLPSTVIYDSGWMGTGPAPEGASLEITDFRTGATTALTERLPADFTWSIMFQGVEGGEEAGLLSSVSIPGTYKTAIFPGCQACHIPESFWIYLASWYRSFALIELDQFPIPMIFRARIEGELPEGYFRAPVVGQGELRLGLIGETGRRYRIEESADLKEWSQVKTEMATNGVVAATVPFSGNLKFYRAVLLDR